MSDDSDSTKSHRGVWLLTGLILTGLVIGALWGQWLFDPDFDTATMPDTDHANAAYLAWFVFIGKTVFMGLLKMLIVPLIVSSVIAGVASVGDFRKLGGLGLYTLAYYFGTMLIAVTVGLMLVNTIQPGEGMNLGAAEVTSGEGPTLSEDRRAALEQRQTQGATGAFKNIVSQMIAPNIVMAAVEGRTLALIVFSIFLGVILTTMGKRGQPLIDLFDALFHAMMKMVHVVIWLAPVGVMCLMAWTVARIGFDVFIQKIGVYMVTVLSGLAVHAFVVLPALLYLVVRCNPFRFLGQMSRALMTAMGTSSSSATLPITMECATEAGVSEKSAGFVLPLGATINMDGTALYEAVAVAFLFQAYGIELGAAQAILIALTATLAAVGAAGIPEAGLVTMVIVIGAVNGSLAGTGKQLPIEAVGLIIGIDRILDMCRTTVNVWGDAVGARMITRIAPDEPPPA